jgi:hypothetical protein
MGIFRNGFGTHRVGDTMMVYSASSVATSGRVEVAQGCIRMVVLARGALTPGRGRVAGDRERTHRGAEKWLGHLNAADRIISISFKPMISYTRVHSERCCPTNIN